MSKSIHSERAVDEFELKRIYWAPLLALTVILSFIGTLLTGLCGVTGGVGFACTFNIGVYSRPIYVASLSVLLPLFIYPVSKLKTKLSPSTLAGLYTVGLVASLYGIGHYEAFALYPVGFTRTYLYSSPDLRTLMESWWWVPPAEAITGMARGVGIAIDWAAWGPTILFWTIYLYVFFFFTSSVMLVFRRRWIDVERVPFPHVIATYETIKLIEHRPEEARTTIPYLIGFILGIVFVLQILLTTIFPWWPDLYAWRKNTSPQGCVFADPTTDPIASVVVHWAKWSKDPLSFGMFYLAPLDVTFTVALFTLIMMILEQVAYTMGYYTGILSLTGCCRTWGGNVASNSFAWGPPFYWLYQSMIGGVVAIVVMMLFYSRSYLADTIRAALRKRSEFEKGEVFSYRTIYIIVAVSAIVLMIFMSIAGISLGPALAILVVGAFVNMLANAYIFGHTGFMYMNSRNVAWEHWPFYFVQPEPQSYTTDWIMSRTFMGPGMNHPTQGVTLGGLVTIQSFAMARLTRTRLKDIYLLTVLSVLLAAPTAVIGRVFIANFLGIGRVPVWGGCDVAHLCDNSFDVWHLAPPINDIFGASIAGFIITVALSLVRARFIWWPIHPLGFLIATSFSAIWFGSWNCFLAAWIVKWITLKVGGSRAYENYGAPAVGGFLAGVTLGYFIGAIVGTIRFFIPF
jgi:hypothetical protein